MSFAFLGESKLLSRIANYSQVSSLLETTKEYYNWGKEVSPTIAFVEQRVEQGFGWIAPKIEPVFQNNSYKNYAQPLLTKVDDLGDLTLQSVESRVEKARSNLNTGKEAIEKTVNVAVDSAYATAKKVGENLVPIDDYLSTSLIGQPLNFAVNISDLLVTKYLPGDVAPEENKEQKQEDDPEKHNGPVVRAGRVGLKVYNKLHSFSLQSSEQKPIQLALGLILYASKTLDKGVSAVKQTGTNLINETPKVRKKIQSVTQEALTALHTAVDTISKQLPPSISSKVHLSLQSNGDSSHEGIFTTVAQRSSGLLQEVTNSLSGYVQKGESIPKQLLQNSVTSLQQVLDGLRTILRKNPTSENNVQEAKETEEEF